MSTELGSSLQILVVRRACRGLKEVDLIMYLTRSVHLDEIEKHVAGKDVKKV